MPNEIKVDNSLLSYSEISLVFQKFVSTVFFLPFEPDLNHLTLWYKFDQWSKTIVDESFFGNDGTLSGGNIQTAHNGPDKGFGPSVCLSFDGGMQNIQASDNPFLRMISSTGSFTTTPSGTNGTGSFTTTSFTISQQTIGFSVGALVFPSTFSPTITGQNRFICSKVDDNSNMYVLFFDTSGAVHFWIYKNGISFSVKSNASILQNTWNWIVATYNAATNTSLLYFNGLLMSTTADIPTESAGSGGGFAQAPTSLFVGCNSASDGFFQGFLSDFRYYREMVLDSFAVSNLNSNFYTTSPIPFGQVLQTGSPIINAKGVANRFFLTFNTTKTVTVPYNVLLDNFSAFTISCWFLASGIGGHFIQKNWSSPGAISMNNDNNGNLTFSIDSNNINNPQYNSTFSTTTNVWHHLAFVYDGNFLTPFLDGVRAALPTAATAAGTLTVNGGFTFGAFQGNLTDIRIYNINLIPNEIYNLFIGTVPVTRGIVARWAFDEQTGTTATDKINGIVGTFVNSPTWGSAVV